MLGSLAKLAPRSSAPAGATSALRRIQVLFWLATLLIVTLFAAVLNWISFDHLFRFTTQALSLERQITCNIVRYHIEEYLADNGYHELLPGKSDTGLNRLLDDLVSNNPSILNIRVVNQERFHVSTAGSSAEALLGPDRRDQCCSVFDIAAQRDATATSAPGDLIAESKAIAGRFHDPHSLGVYCVDAPLLVNGQLMGMVAIHEDNPLSRVAYQQAKRSNRILIFAASALLLFCLALTVTFTSREIRRIEERLAASDRNASLGNLAAGVAHEIRNPLNTIALSCSFLSRRLAGGDAEAQESVDLIAGEVKRMQSTIDSFVHLARTPRLQLTQVDVDELIAVVIESLSPEIEANRVRVIHQAGPGALAIADRSRLREALVNLLRNAVQAIAAQGNGGEVRISTRTGRRNVFVEVADDGEGIEPDALRHIFEPYFTTKDDGLGLGLAQVRQDLIAHGGDIEVESARGIGTRFTLRLPSER